MSITRSAQITLADDYTGLTENNPIGRSNVLDTGDLRRKYNFGNRVSEMRTMQDPFFRILSLMGKKPTDDPEFKFVEKRDSFHKRYCYVVEQASTEGGLAASETLPALSADDTLWLKVKGDYKTSGNIGSVYGQSNNKVDIGDTGTMPTFFLPGLELKIPTNSDVTSWDVEDYVIVRIVAVTTDSANEQVKLQTLVVRPYSGSNNILTSFTAAGTPLSTVYDKANAIGTQPLEHARSYISGNAWGRGTDYPLTYIDQPYSTDYGYTQIFKTSAIMDNTTRATVLKYEGNDWMRTWTEKLIQHKWDIETALLFGTLHKDTSNIYYTEGAVNYAMTYGNIFSLDYSTKTHDGWVEDMAQFMDPRYNSDTEVMYQVPTKTWTWLHKMAGYHKNNLDLDAQFRSSITDYVQGNYRGLLMSRLKLATGPIMNVVRNIHLDSTPIKMLGVNMKHAKYRPLIGNGINRDTSVYVAVESLENGGTDARVDLILTEAGLEMSGRERHAVWL